jgi:nucleotide-binding universal stress UspA family protein
MTYKKILICTDFSDMAKNALTYGKELSAKTGAKLGLIHICDSFDTNSVVFQMQDIVADGKTYKQLITDNLESQLALDIEAVGLTKEQVTTHLDFGPIKNKLSDFIKDNDYDLVLFGQHGHGFIEDLLLGSVSEKMLKMSTKDVLVTKGKNSSAPKSLHATVDFTELSEKVIQKTKTLAKELGAKVTLSHLVELNPQIYLGVNEAANLKDADSIQEMLEKEKSISYEKLTKIQESFMAENIETNIDIQIAKDFRVAENIIEYQNEFPHDLTICAAHGKNAFERFFFGSTARKIVELSKSNVLIIKE